MSKNDRTGNADFHEDAALDLSAEDFWDNDDSEDNNTDDGDSEIDPYIAKISVESFEDDGERGANVFVDGYTHEEFLMGNFKATHEVTKIRIARVTKQKLETWPINLRPDKDDYLQPKYKNLKKITVLSSGRKYWTIPEDRDDFDDILQRLPTGFSKQVQYGLGLKWEYRHIFFSIAEIASVEQLLMPDDDTTALDGSIYSLGMIQFEALRRALDNIGRRYQREALDDKKLLAYNSLLHKVDLERFPVKTKKIKPGALYELVKLGDRQKRTPADRKAALDVVQSESKALLDANPVELMRLKTSIEIVTLEKLINKFEEMMSQKLTEEKWRKFFESNPFILSLAFACPVFMIRSHAFVGGTTLYGAGEKIADFLLKNRYSGNVVLVEIKRPDTILLTENVYREDLYGPGKHLGSAISQVLDQKFHLQTNFTSKVYESKLHDTHPYSTQCIVIIGSMPSTDVEKKSFEFFRNACRDVIVITFDEVLGKLKEIHRVMNTTDGVEELTTLTEAASDGDVL